MEPLVVFDGGSAGSTGPGSLSGGSAGSTGSLVTGGDASTTPVELPDGTDTVTLWWRSEGRSGRVRGVIGRFFTGAGGFLDMEASFDVPTTYELECFSGTDRLGRVTLGSVSLPAFGDPWQVLVQQPLNPSLNVVLEASTEHGSTAKRSSLGEVVQVEGQSLPYLIGSGVRSGVATELWLKALTRADAARAWATLGTQENPQIPVWLIRGPGLLLPHALFCDALTVEEISIDVQIGGQRSIFRVDTTEVAPPAPGLVISPLTYEDLDVSFPSYDARDAAFATYDEMDSAWEYAGAAGGS